VPTLGNNVGVFQWSEISAILFIVYMGDVMNDYQSLNGQHRLPQRYTTQASVQTNIQQILAHIPARSSKNTTNMHMINKNQKHLQEARSLETENLKMKSPPQCNQTDLGT